VKKEALGLKEHLLTSGGMPESILQLKEQVQKLEDEQLKLRSLLEEKK